MATAPAPAVDGAWVIEQKELAKLAGLEMLVIHLRAGVCKRLLAGAVVEAGGAVRADLARLLSVVGQPVYISIGPPCGVETSQWVPLAGCGVMLRSILLQARQTSGVWNRLKLAGWALRFLVWRGSVDLWSWVRDRARGGCVQEPR